MILKIDGQTVSDRSVTGGRLCARRTSHATARTDRRYCDWFCVQVVFYK